MPQPQIENEPPTDDQRRWMLLQLGVEVVHLDHVAKLQSERDARTITEPACDACHEPFDVHFAERHREGERIEGDERIRAQFEENMRQHLYVLRVREYFICGNCLAVKPKLRDPNEPMPVWRT
jgi:hypothetical protein